MPLTYDELIRRVPIWLYAENRSITQEMPSIVEQAEDRLVQMVDHDLFKTVITGKTIGVDGSLDLSAETPPVLEVRAVRVRYRNYSDGWTPLQVMDLETLTMMYPRDRQDMPRYYAERQGVLKLQVFPKPRSPLDVEVTANVEPLRLGPAQQTNIYTEMFPRVIEKACLYYGAVFMKNPNDAGMHEKDMMAALQEASAQIGRRRRDETGKRPRETHNMTGN